MGSGVVISIIRSHLLVDTLSAFVDGFRLFAAAQYDCKCEYAFASTQFLRVFLRINVSVCSGHN